MATLREEIEKFAAELTQDEDFATAPVLSSDVAATLRSILDTTPDHRFFDDGLAHAVPVRALCGKRGVFPEPDMIGATADDCPECAARLARMLP